MISVAEWDAARVHYNTNEIVKKAKKLQANISSTTLISWRRKFARTSFVLRGNQKSCSPRQRTCSQWCVGDGKFVVRFFCRISYASYLVRPDVCLLPNLKKYFSGKRCESSEIVEKSSKLIFSQPFTVSLLKNNTDIGKTLNQVYWNQVYWCIEIKSFFNWNRNLLLSSRELFTLPWY